MTQEQLNEIIESHQHYLNKDIDGWENMRADLSCKNLSGLDLKNVNLKSVNLYKTNLRNANLRNADLNYTYLYKTDLSYADLRHANLNGAFFREANLLGTKIDYPIACPEIGSFIGYKKAYYGYIVKLQICEDAKRSSATTKKCRCSKALVLAIENIDESDSGLQGIASIYDPSFIYRVGEIVEVSDFDDNRWRECAPGIHFFMDRQDAVEYEF